MNDYLPFRAAPWHLDDDSELSAEEVLSELDADEQAEEDAIARDDAEAQRFWDQYRPTGWEA